MAQTVPTDVILPTQPARELPAGPLDRDGGSQGCVGEGPGRLPGHADARHLSQPDLSDDRSRARRRDLRIRRRPAPLSAGRRLRPDRSVRGHRSLRAEPAARAGSRHVLEACLRHHPFAVSAGRLSPLGALLLAIFSVWLAVAHAIYEANFGIEEPTTLCRVRPAGADHAAGQNLIIVGNVVGFLFAAAGFLR